MTPSPVLEHVHEDSCDSPVIVQRTPAEVSKMLEESRKFLEAYAFNPPCFEDFKNGTMVRPQG